MDGSSTSSLVRSDVWFEDGTVVLQAETTLFRVYRGVLAAQSPIFRDTFAIPQPPTPETYEGCPLVVLPDAPGELRYFLMATHDAGYFTNTPVADIGTLSALLNLSTKYEVEHVRIRMVAILTCIYPSSLTGWLSRKPPAGYEEGEDDDLIALGLALQHQILPVLPGIYYECCRFQTSMLLDSDDISLKDKTRCIMAKENFMEDSCRDIYAFLFDPADACSKPVNCLYRRLCWLKQNGSPTLAWIFDGDFDWETLPICSVCMDVGKASFYEKRVAFWDTLPTLFDLDGWEDLISPDSMQEE
ncbi:hypothetical protein B0H16DRAFT_1586082 [Mycena metata]|uniref:BTB domain-containing protein n=1 Tax=Mycena metata TaxID=1033252 RepID=A0AAD7HY56_9AGAR|nr:hypothetical protein B0H16DRAFT_1586082 [Mycena metata]